MQRAGGAMKGLHWPAAAALAIALTGCHAIYGGHDAPGPAAAVKTPSNRASTIENTTETPSGGSGATVGTAAAGMAVAAVAGTLAGRYFGNRLGSRVDDTPPRAAATAQRHAPPDNAPAHWNPSQCSPS